MEGNIHSLQDARALDTRWAIIAGFASAAENGRARSVEAAKGQGKGYGIEAVKGQGKNFLGAQGKGKDKNFESGKSDQHPTRFLVPTKQHPRYKKYMFATLAKSMDKSHGPQRKQIRSSCSLTQCCSRTDHNANKLEALVLWRNVVSYSSFILFFCRPLRRALASIVPNKQHWTYTKDMLATLAGSTQAS